VIVDKLALVGQEILRIFADMAPFLLLGFLLSGILHVVLPSSLVRRALGGHGLKPVLKAALVGAPLPLCSCAALPMALSLRQQGASRGATVSFLVSTPETDAGSILITYGLLGPIFAIGRPVAAILTAVVAGVLEELVPASKTEEPVADTCCSVCKSENGNGHSHSAGEKAGRALQYAFVELLEDTAKWLVIGIVLAGIIGAFLTPDFVSTRLGSPLLQMGLMLLVGVPMYTCASASTPIAAAFVAAGFSPGAALVFLLVGPATNATTVTFVARFIGKGAAAIYVLSIAGMSVALGLALNFLVGTFGWHITAGAAPAGEEATTIVQVLAALVLGGLIVLSIARGFARRHTREHAH
jgi:uncharacterized protein